MTDLRKSLEAASEAIISDYFAPQQSTYMNMRKYCIANFEFADWDELAPCWPHYAKLDSFIRALREHRSHPEYRDFIMATHNYTALVDREHGEACVTFIFRGPRSIDDGNTVRETADKLLWRVDRAAGLWKCYKHCHGGNVGFP